MKLGIDIVSIRRFSKIKKTDYQSWTRVFSKSEWRYSFKDAHFADHLAGIFAAKEAALKAVGKPARDRFRTIAVSYTKGAPTLNIPTSAVSITHDGGYAVACVFISR